jgi:WD40 repeat protein
MWVDKEGRDAGEARIWDAATGREIGILVGHTDAVRAVDFSPDGDLLATGSMDGSVRIWDVETKRFQAKVVCPTVIEMTKRQAESAMRERGRTVKYDPMPTAESVVFSPDGLTLAATFGERTIPGKRDGVGVVQLWEVRTGVIKAVITHHGNFVSQVAYCPNGDLLASAGHDGSVELWDVDTLKEAATVEGNSPIAFAPDGNHIVVNAGDASLRLRTIRRRQSVPGTTGG